MFLQKIVFIMIAKLIIADDTKPGHEDDYKDNNLVFEPNMNNKELLAFCYSHSTYVRVKTIERKCTIFQVESREPQLSANSENRVRVLQWNILAQVLGQSMDKFIMCPKPALEWVYRRCLILDEILTYEPDILCLQEVDHFNFFNRALATQSYSAVWLPKLFTPCTTIPGNNGPDGCAIFYNNNKYELLEKFERNFYHIESSSGQVVLLVVLKNKSSGTKFCVATTHLKSRKGREKSILRNKQGQDILAFVIKHAKGCPTVITGDFNAEPDEPVYDTMCQSPRFKLKSAYHVSGKEPEFTSWKIREDEGEVKETLDYIFYTPDHLTVSSIIAMPSERNVDENRIPSFCYPSDHFSLIADFVFNKP